MLIQSIRLGTHAEAEFLRKLPTSFDWLGLNANLVVGTPAASVSLVYTLKKPYWIDPFTHAFCAPPRFLQSRRKDKTAKVAPKRTFVALAERYFGRSEFVGQRSLRPEDIDAPELAARVLNFQETWFKQEALRDEFILESGMLEPVRKIAPYFPIRSDKEWLEVDIELVAESVALDADVAAMVPLSAALLNRQNDVVDRFVSTGVKSVILWIESLDEDRAELSALRKYRELIEAFSGAGLTVGNAFGGFPSCLLQDFGLVNFTHGLVYGETKSFTPILGGGQPPPRYYFRPGHITMSVPDAELLLNGVAAEDYVKNVCDCAICIRLMSDASGNVPAALARFSEVDQENKYTPAAYALSRFHFLLVRRAEVRQYAVLTSEGKRTALQLDLDYCRSLGALDFATHLGRYERLISQGVGI